MKLTISSLLLTLCLLTCTANSTELNTGNILSNSTFGTGNTTTTTGWSTDGDEGVHTHGAWNGFPYQTGMDDSGGVLAFEGHEEDNVYQDVDLVDDGHLTQQQMNQGFTSTMGADVWFWNNIENTLTLKQTITGADGSVSTQVREITGTSTTDGNTFTNYTNVHIQGSNTQTDITIRSELYNETAGTAYDDYHRGPDVDNVTLDITYQDIPPINEDTQDVIDNIENNIPDIPEDIFEEPDFTFEEEYFTWEEDFYFDDSFTMEEDFSVYEMPEEFQIIEMPEEFEEMVMEMPDDMPMEMPADMEDAFTIIMEEEMPEMEMTEEPTEMEMETEFVEMEMEEDRPNMEEVKEEPAEMDMAEEETVDMEMETEEDTMEMPEEEAEEMEVAENDDTMEEPKENEESSEGADEALEEESGSEESVSETAANEEEAVGDTNVADKGGIKTKNIEVSKNIKIKSVDVGEIKITVNPKDIFKEVVSLDSYKSKDFYKDKGLQYKVNDNFFDQASMIQYNKEIYTNVTLIAYIQTDPVTVYRREMEELAIQKAGIMIELKLLRGN